MPTFAGDIQDLYEIVEQLKSPTTDAIWEQLEVQAEDCYEHLQLLVQGYVSQSKNPGRSAPEPIVSGYEDRVNPALPDVRYMLSEIRNRDAQRAAKFGQQALKQLDPNSQLK